MYDVVLNCRIIYTVSNKHGNMHYRITCVIAYKAYHIDMCRWSFIR